MSNNVSTSQIPRAATLSNPSHRVGEGHENLSPSHLDARNSSLRIDPDPGPTPTDRHDCQRKPAATNSARGRIERRRTKRNRARGGRSRRYLTSGGEEGSATRRRGDAGRWVRRGRRRRRIRDRLGGGAGRNRGRGREGLGEAAYYKGSDGGGARLDSFRVFASLTPSSRLWVWRIFFKRIKK
jgi:hypothetical protein